MKEMPTISIEKYKRKKPRFFLILLIILIVVFLTWFIYAYVFKSSSLEISNEKSQTADQEDTILEQAIKKAKDLEQQEVDEEKILKVTIQETPTGWLRVRKGPGTSYEEITKINPGETYELLQESENWYKIKIDIDKHMASEGWIFGEYASKSE